MAPRPDWPVPITMLWRSSESPRGKGCCAILGFVLGLVLVSLLATRVRARSYTIQPPGLGRSRPTIRGLAETAVEGLPGAPGTTPLPQAARISEAPPPPKVVLKPRNVFVLTHLLKGGGTAARKMVAEVLEQNRKPRYLRQVIFYAPNQTKENSNMLRLRMKEYGKSFPFLNISEAKQRVFSVGFVRSPGDYLVSMWAFQSKCKRTFRSTCGHGKWPRICLDRAVNGSAETFYASHDLTDAEKIARFRAWVRAAAGMSRLHYLSYRTYLTLHIEPTMKDIRSWDDGQYYACLADVPPDVEERALATLAEVNLLDRFDCMVHNEKLVEELRGCVEQYAAQLESPADRSMVLERLALAAHSRASLWNPTRKSHPNKSPHLSCQAYFDKDTCDFVWEREGVLAPKGNYTTCCAR